MSGVADRDWLLLANSQFDMRLKDAYLRLREYLGPSEAVQRLTALACTPLMPVMVRYANSLREEILPVEDQRSLIQTEYNPFSNKSIWGEDHGRDEDPRMINLSVGIDAAGADCLNIHDRRYFHPAESEINGPAEYFVRSVDIGQEERRAADAERKERPDQTIAAVPPPSKEPNRTLRRRETKHPWFEICGEIARRCIDSKTQRVEVPTNEAKLGEAILQWCSDTLEREPAESEVREAVRIICAALRKI
jgi:hypothetical protein